jgi:hypothetical protein
MGLSVTSETSPAARVMAQVETWPGIIRVRADCGVGQALAVEGSQIIHLHHDNTVEVRLGRPVIARMGEALLASEQVAIRPYGHAGSDWVGVCLQVPADERLAMALASVAIQEVTDRRSSGCSRIGLGRTSAGVRNSVREQQAMRQVTDRLTRSFAPSRSERRVAQTVSAVHHRFDGRPVRDFVPVLVERYARQELAARY